MYVDMIANFYTTEKNTISPKYFITNAVDDNINNDIDDKTGYVENVVKSDYNEETSWAEQSHPRVFLYLSPKNS